MGTRWASTYANMFMAEFEEKYIYPFKKQRSMLYLRFIDGIFTIGTKSENELKIFMKDLNTKHPFIKFSFKYSKDKIILLSTLVSTNIKNCTLPKTNKLSKLLKCEL